MSLWATKSIALLRAEADATGEGTLKKTLGALNLYSEKRAAFGAEADEIGVLFAALAGAALGAAQTEEGLNIAIGNRDVIGQGKGILMERHRITADEAFEMLRRASQRLNVRLANVAEQVALTGESPAPV